MIRAGEIVIIWTSGVVDLRVKKVGEGARNCNFLMDSCEFPTKDIMRVQNFNFAPPPEFEQMRNLEPHILYFWKKVLAC